MNDLFDSAADPYLDTPDPVNPEVSAIEASEIVEPNRVAIAPEFYHAFTDPDPDLDLIPLERTPNFGHLAILTTLCLAAGFITVLLTGLALHFHLFGISTLEQAATDIRYALGSQIFFYLLALVGSLVIFPHLWFTGFFTGLHWNSPVVHKRLWLLLLAVLLCFSAAMLDGAFFSQPKDAPIDQLFRMPGAPWFILLFGVTVAPFFEEMAFRGFLLPALATAFDWTREHFTHRPAPLLDANNHPQWSVPAQIVASILTSLPFALMHAPQNAGSIGSLVLMIVVSLILCAVGLTTRSLAASTFVHASYNLILFALMLIGTQGFHHLENL